MKICCPSHLIPLLSPMTISSQCSTLCLGTLFLLIIVQRSASTTYTRRNILYHTKYALQDYDRNWTHPSGQISCLAQTGHEVFQTVCWTWGDFRCIPNRRKHHTLDFGRHHLRMTPACFCHLCSNQVLESKSDKAKNSSQRKQKRQERKKVKKII